jgi:hypothetical protein
MTGATSRGIELDITGNPTQIFQLMLVMHITIWLHGYTRL